MRLTRLQLEAYGNFAALDLAFDPALGRITLVAAPNGAGKSVLRQALSELLFGIHPQTPMGFGFDYTRMRLHAEAVAADGTPFGFTRRKGRANTVLDPAGRPADPALLARLPRDIERKRLERLFVLDSQQLRQGGRALLQTDGDLADALLSGAGELGSARTLAADLGARRDAMAPERRSATTPFYRAADAWVDASRRLAAGLVRPAEVAALEAERDGATAARDAANTGAAEAARSLARLARIRSTRHHLEALDTAEAWLAANPDAPDLPPAAATALVDARNAAAQAEQAEAAAVQSLSALRDQRQVLTVDDAALAEAEAITALDEERGRARQSTTDLPQRQAELAEAERAVASLLRDLSSRHGPANGAAELRNPADIAAARDLASRADGLATRLATAREAAEGHRSTLAQAEDEAAALPQAGQAGQVQALLDAATTLGDPAQLAAAADAARSEAQAELDAALARVPNWTGGAAALAHLPVCDDATLTRLDRTLADATRQQAATAAAATACAAEMERLEHELAQLTARPLPDEAALAAARRHRDAGWALVAARLDGRPDFSTEAAYAPGGLAPTVRRAMDEADAVADRRMDEVERLATAEQLRASLARARTLATQAQHAAGQAAAARDTAGVAWAASVAGLPLASGAGLAEAQAWLAARNAATDAAARHAGANRHCAALGDSQAAAASSLAAALHCPAEPLATLVPMARRRLEDAQRAEAQRTALLRTIKTAQRGLTSANTALSEAEQAQAAWTAQWDAVLHRLGRPTGEPPAATSAVLDRLVELPGKLDAAASLRGRLAEMQTQLDRFAHAAGSLAARLNQPNQDPFAASQHAAARLATARQQSSARDTLDQAAATAETRHQTAGRTRANAEHARDRAIRATGATTLDAAEHCLRLAAERHAHAAARDAARRALAEDGDGMGLAALRTEAAAVPPDALPGAMQAAQAQAETAQADAQTAAAQIERATEALHQRLGTEEAARAATDQQAAAASLAQVLEDALLQHVAAAMLNDALHAVEASSGTNARLDRIGATFATLTGGSYDSVVPAEEDGDSRDHGRLLARTPGGHATHLANLSEGTRDQLYLALRLVAIEDHVRSGPALPFLADDILQTFDDARARAALQALIGLSQHVQVVVLTHHEHLVGLAGDLPVDVRRFA